MIGYSESGGKQACNIYRILLTYPQHLAFSHGCHFPWFDLKLFHFSLNCCYKQIPPSSVVHQFQRFRSHLEILGTPDWIWDISWGIKLSSNWKFKKMRRQNNDVKQLVRKRKEKKKKLKFQNFSRNLIFYIAYVFIGFKHKLAGCLKVKSCAAEGVASSWKFAKTFFYAIRNNKQTAQPWRKTKKRLQAGCLLFFLSLTFIEHWEQRPLAAEKMVGEQQVSTSIRRTWKGISWASK